MKRFIFNSLILTQLISGLTWAQSHGLTLEDKIAIVQNANLQEAAEFLTPEQTKLTAQLQKTLAENPDLDLSPDGTKLHTGLVTVGLFVAARAYGDYIRGNGKFRDVPYQRINDQKFDLY